MSSSAERFVQFLRSVPLDSPPSDEDLKSILSLPVADRFYPAGTFLMEEGEARREVLFISSGWALSYKSMPNGHRAVSDFLQRGDLVSCNPVVSRAGSTIEAATDVTTFEIDGQKSHFAIRSPYIANAIMWRMARNYDIAAEHLASVSRRRPIQRLAFLFLEVAYRYQQSGATQGDRFTFPFTQRDLADALGLSAIHVNRLLRLLREDKLLRFQRWTVELLNKKGLVEIASFNPSYLSLSKNSPLLIKYLYGNDEL